MHYHTLNLILSISICIYLFDALSEFLFIICVNVINIQNLKDICIVSTQLSTGEWLTARTVEEE